MNSIERDSIYVSEINELLIESVELFAYNGTVVQSTPEYMRFEKKLNLFANKYKLINTKGSKSKVKKLTGKEAEIKTLLDKKISKSAIARILGVHRLTVAELQTHLVQKLISFNNWLFGKNYYFLLMGIMMTNKMAVCKSCANKKQIRQLLLLQLPDFHLCPRRT